MKPFARLQGLVGRSFDAVASALSEVPGLLNHESHRIAITGLQRAGKTVFVTSFAHALLQAENAPKGDFPFFPWRGEVQNVAVSDIPGIPSFPYRDRLDDLLADTPKWPSPTMGLTGLRIRIQHLPKGIFAKKLASKETLDLDLIDYPGEWLLDLPMLSQSYQEWSAQMEELANGGGRATLANSWLQEAKSLDPTAQADAAKLASIGGLYVDYLKRCRSEQSLYYLQPGRFLANDLSGPGADAIFFPLSGVKAAKAGTNAAALAKRYDAYRRLVRRFYRDVFGRLRRQVILIDLLTALQNGHEAFADLALATRTISEAFEALKNPFLKLLPFGRVDRLALVATKADHVTADQMANLTALLLDMIGKPFMLVGANQSALLAIASVRSTTQIMLKSPDGALPFLHGIPNGRDDDAIEVWPGVIPGQIPDAAQWKALGFHIRDFAPPRLGASYEKRPLPHINLDKVLQFLIA